MQVITQENHFEVTIRDEPLSEVEVLFMQTVADDHDVDFSVSKSGRVVLFSKVENMHALAEILADMGIAQEIGLIKEVREYWPEYDDEPWSDPFIESDI